MKKTMMYLYNYIGFEESVEFKRFARALNKIFRSMFSGVDDNTATDVVEVMGAAFANHILNLLFKFAFANTCDCDLGAYDKDYLAEVVGWPLESDLLIDALVSSGFLILKDGGGYLLYDWGEMIGRRMREREKESNRLREYRANKRALHLDSERSMYTVRTPYEQGTYTERTEYEQGTNSVRTPCVQVKGEDRIRDEMNGEEERGSAAPTPSTSSELSLFPVEGEGEVEKAVATGKKKKRRFKEMYENVVVDPRLIALLHETYEFLPRYTPDPELEDHFAREMTFKYPDFDLIRAFTKGMNYLKDNPSVQRKYKSLTGFMRDQVEREYNYQQKRAAQEYANTYMFEPDDDEMGYFYNENKG